jgi:alpha-1,6-mannosyltransferase
MPASPPSRDLPRSLLLGGLAGSALIALGGLGRGALPRDGTWLGASWPVDTATGRLAALLLVLAGGALLVGAWWLTQRVLEDVAPGALLRATALWSVPLLLGPPLFSRDVYAYGAQAWLAAEGLDPYAGGPAAGSGPWLEQVDEVWRDTPSPYGPAFLGAGALAVRLAGGSVEAGVLLLRLLAVAGLVLTAWALPRLASRCGVPAQRALWLGLANPLGLLHGVSGAHNDALMVGLMVGGLALGLAALDPGRSPSGAAGRLVAAGALVVLGALVKAVALVALPALVLAVAGWRARARAGALLAGGGAAVALVLPLATGLGWGWAQALDAGRSLLSLFSPVTGLATLLGAGARTVGLAAETATVRDPLLDAAAVVSVLVAGALLLLSRRLGPVRAVGLALLALVLLSPTVLPWYLLWAVVPLAASSGPRVARGLGALCGVLCFATWPSGRSVVRPPLYGAQLLAGLAVAALATRAGDRRPASKSCSSPR